uniref:Putative LOC100902024 [Metaseiulus occidentalis] n=1 Tax=Lepeophtheirus salmonis TaxID=72036 RepID=A0A0K2VJH4_LEPSM
MMTILIGPVDGHFCARPYLMDLTDIEIANTINVKNIVISSVYKLMGELMPPRIVSKQEKILEKNPGIDLQYVYCS